MNEQPPIRAPRDPSIEDQPAEDQHQQMAHFGITAEQRSVYHYRGYVYERLSDALAYATLDTARQAQAREPGKVSSGGASS